MALRLVDFLVEVLGTDGVTLFQANRQAGWHEVPHLHVHVVPRRDGDGLVRPWEAPRVDEEALRTVAGRLRR